MPQSKDYLMVFLHCVAVLISDPPHVHFCYSLCCVVCVGVYLFPYLICTVLIQKEKQKQSVHHTLVC
jgi:hypothetical protein